jgi:type I restriction enzyme M protein
MPMYNYSNKTKLTNEVTDTLLVIYDKYKAVTNHRVLGRYFQVMLFFKYISDYWKYTLEKNRQLLGNDQEHLERRMKNERFILNETVSYDHVSRQKYNADIGEIINLSLSKLTGLNYKKLEGIFGHVDFNSEYNLGSTKIRNSFLSDLLRHFDTIDLSPSNPSSEAVIDEYIKNIENFTDVTSRKGDDFFTPKEVCLLLARLLKPESGSRISDPCCGPGGLLIAAAKCINNPEDKVLPDYSLYGQDINKEIVAWAKMNMYMHGLDGFKIAWGNVITDPAWKEKGNNLLKFDIVISNPPFSVENWELEFALKDPYGRFNWGIPPKTRGDYAFIQHMIASADKKGRIGVVVPNSLLFREGRETDIRAGIIKDNLLEAVISLPTNLFSHTTVPCAIMLFNKAKKQSTNVLFIDGSKCYIPGKTGNVLKEKDIEEIIQIYHSFRENDLVDESLDFKNYANVTVKEIAAQNYNLTVSRYVQLNDIANMNINDLVREIEELQNELKLIESDLQAGLSELGLK